jgi:hypothetical protein
MEFSDASIFGVLLFAYSIPPSKLLSFASSRSCASVGVGTKRPSRDLGSVDLLGVCVELSWDFQNSSFVCPSFILSRECEEY